MLSKIEGMGTGYASVSVVGDRLYTTGNRDDAQCVIAVDLKKNEVAWVTPITQSVPKHGYDGSRTTPTIDGDRLYVVSSDGNIVCLKTDGGAVVWSKNFKKEWNGKMHSGWGFSESPLVDGDNVLCTPGGDDAAVVCLKKSTGDLVWKTVYDDPKGEKNNGAGYASIVVSNGAGVKQYVTLVGRGLIGIRASDGKLLWTYNRVANKTANIPTPLIKGDYVFTSSGYNDGGSALVKLSKDGAGVNAEEIYYFGSKDLQNHHGGMILDGDYVYMGHGHNNGFPMCVEFMTGKKMWKEGRGPDGGSAAITWVDGYLIFRYQKDGIVALIKAIPEKYELVGKFKPAVKEKESWAQPVVVNGKLFLREQDTLMIYDVAK
ncbi:MAG: PQQ-binding-like beta-propeller repeat protein [Pirellulales bacterium]